jgi:hypothetical protein
LFEDIIEKKIRICRGLLHLWPSCIFS